MTALSQYDRLEAVGLWRASKDAQRTEVIVSLGERSLVLSNAQNQALAHWSLAAVTRANMGRGGGAASAIYHPIGDPDEELEIAETESAMIEAIETLRRKLNRGRSRPGRLRLFLFAGVVLGLLALGQLWLPEALRNHAVAVAPKVKRVEIGKALMAHVLPITGRPCTGFEASRALGQLQRRVLGHADTPVFVVTDGISTTKVLPGGMVLINSTVLEDHENPDVLAGYLLAQSLRHKMQDPLEDVLRFGGLWGTLQFLTRGTVSDDQLADYALEFLQKDPIEVSDAALIAGFEKAQLSTKAYAYARDVTGEKTLPLIEANPYPDGPPEPLLSDTNWVRLQNICAV